MSADPHPTPSLAPFRLEFSPSYILVGVYRLSTDSSIRVPVWKKCKHAFVRGIVVGFAWVSPTATARPTASPHPTLPQAFFTFGIQKSFIQFFLSKCGQFL